MSLLRTLAIFLLGFSLMSCATKPIHQDGAPKHPKSVKNVKVPVPKKEAKSKWGNPKSYKVFGKKYDVMPSAHGYSEKGIASWYGTQFHGRRTSNGETYDMYAMTAAHKSLPLPSYVRVKNLDNGKSTIVRVNDRGPFHKGRIIDLSYAAAVKLGVFNNGTANVEVTAITDGKEVIPAPVIAASKPIYPQEDTYVQFGSFSSKDNANEYARQLRELLTDKVIISETTKDNQKLYRVQTGPFANRHKAHSYSKKLLAQNIISSLYTAD